jgi:endonuclease/exonuclease/phosphatase (EEP) superfamily protein YafD
MVIADILAWAAIAVVAVVLVTELAGWCGLVIVAVLQALTPVLAGATVFAAIVGRIDDNWLLLGAALAATAGVAIAVAPVVRRRAPVPDPASALAPTLRVFHGNLLFTNVGDPFAVATTILATGADILALSELNPQQERALADLAGADSYPYRIGHASRRADGMAIWSAVPLDDVARIPDELRDGITARVPIGDGALRLLFAHPSAPTERSGLRYWRPALPRIDSIGRSPVPPTLVVGDLNAAHWHPPLRRMLRGGWRDAHEAVGRGLSVSWPTDGRWPVPFVRLDHALLGPGVTAIAVDDVSIPGSDHRAFVVTVTVPGHATVEAP